MARAPEKTKGSKRFRDAEFDPEDVEALTAGWAGAGVEQVGKDLYKEIMAADECGVFTESVEDYSPAFRSQLWERIKHRFIALHTLNLAIAGAAGDGFRFPREDSEDDPKEVPAAAGATL